MIKTLAVVPLAGDVDRNLRPFQSLRLDPVVPLAGDVDRNFLATGGRPGRGSSSPSRGTWIEIDEPR